MYKRQPLPLDDFLANLQTFDIVLMRGILNTSKEAEALTNSKLSHVGMVVVAGDLGLPNTDPTTRLYWEANTADTAINLLTNSYYEGPQLVYLTDRIIHNFWIRFDAAFVGRKLMFTRTPGMINTLKSVMDATEDATLPYTDKNAQATELMSFLAGRFGNTTPIPGYSCSQLLAHTYMALGLLTTQYVSNSYMPGDFTEEIDVSLLQGAWLGREFRLDINTLPPKPADYKPYQPPSN